MSIQAHIDSLSAKRELLKQRIAEESARPLPDLMYITTLKKQNLAIKEEMQRYLELADVDTRQTTS